MPQFGGDSNLRIVGRHYGSDFQPGNTRLYFLENSEAKTDEFFPVVSGEPKIGFRGRTDAVFEYALSHTTPEQLYCA